MHTRRITRAICTLLLSSACSLIALPVAAQQTAPDNTKVDKADRANGAVTADQQKDLEGTGPHGSREDIHRSQGG